eukprot:2145203-Prymnesium_polylepis.1
MLAARRATHASRRPRSDTPAACACRPLRAARRIAPRRPTGRARAASTRRHPPRTCLTALRRCSLRWTRVAHATPLHVHGPCAKVWNGMFSP